MNRRQSIALTLGGFAACAGCRRRESGDGGKAGGDPTVAVPAPKKSERAPREGESFAPVRVDPALEIRTTVGLRPYRPAGFVVRREERAGKTLVHNYGHGGGGITLSWGSAHLAVDLAGPVAGMSCAVIGGGVMGLSTARLLQRRGAAVTLYTRDLPPETTSNMAGAQWWPFSVFDSRRRTEAFGAQFVEAARRSYREFQNLVGPRWGVRWVPNYYLSEHEPHNGWIGGPGGVLHDLQVGFRDFGPGEHVFPAPYARRFFTMLIEPATYLATLLRDVRGAGGRVEIRDFGAPEEALGLPHPLVFNCTGLGARALFGDDELMPIKGQLTVLLPQPEVQYNLISGSYYMFPRSDGIVLGGTFERGVWDPAPNLDAKRRILAGQQALFEGMARNQVAPA